MAISAIATAGVRRHDGEQIDGTRYRSEYPSNQAGDNAVPGGGGESRQVPASSDQIEDEAGNEQANGERDQHRVNGMGLNMCTRTHSHSRRGPAASYKEWKAEWGEEDGWGSGSSLRASGSHASGFRCGWYSLTVGAHCRFERTGVLDPVQHVRGCDA